MITFFVVSNIVALLVLLPVVVPLLSLIFIVPLTMILGFGLLSSLVPLIPQILIGLAIAPVVIALIVGGIWGEEIWAGLVWLFEWFMGLFGGGGEEALESVTTAFANLF